MKPHKLQLENIGAFTNKVEINFDQLESLFLVTGTTGSGKTTLFDALVFALFGVVPGSRDPKNLVSDHAIEGVIPRVVFEFSLHGDKYKIERNPPHLIAKKRGTGFKQEDQKVALWSYENQKWNATAGTLSVINTKLQDLLKIKADEFCKIILLPQGEFQKFLEANSQDKAKLLEHLFPIAEHKKITDTLKAKANESLLQSKLLQKQLEDLNFNEVEFNQKWDQINNVLDETLKEKETIQLIFDQEKINASNQERINSLFTSLTILKKDKESFDLEDHQFQKENIKQAKAAALLEPLVLQKDSMHQKISKRKCSLEDLDKEKHDLESLVVTLNNKDQIVNDKKSSIQSMQKVKHDFDLALQAANEAIILEGRIDHSEKALNKVNIYIESLDENKRKLVLKSETLELLKENVHDIELKKNNEKEYLVNVKTDKNAKLEEFKLQVDLQRVEEVILCIMEEKTDLDIHYKKMYTEFLKEKGVFIAAKLIPGKACPVCGSKDHPNITNGSDVKEQDIVELEEQILTIQNKYQDALTRRDIMTNTIKNTSWPKETLEMLEKDLLQFTKNIHQYHNLMEKYTSEIKAIGDVKQKLFSLENLFNDEQVKQNKYQASLQEMKGQLNSKKRPASKDIILENIADISQKLQDEEDALLSLQDEITSIKIRDVKIKSSIESETKLVTDLVFELDQVSKKLKDKSNSWSENEILTLAKSYSIENENDLIELEKRYFENSEKIKVIQEQIQDATYLDTESLLEKIKSLSLQLNNIELKQKDLEKEQTILSKQNSDYQNLYLELIGFEDKYGALLSWARDLGGGNAKRLTFPSFVLGLYLRQVAEKANIRMYKMSEGRYAILVNDMGGKRSQNGLELDVFDSYTGKIRSVKSLSGGEKFLTSISLALGLSDVIQERSGGLSIESLFIDEGFGSLDQSSLEKAMCVLDELKDGRCIGIISHVQELKSRIPSQIEITKGVNGSNIKVA